jgi:hypothetical protein
MALAKLETNFNLGIVFFSCFNYLHITVLQKSKFWATEP